MRYKLIETRRAYGALFFHGTSADALAAAETMMIERDCPILVVEHPENGTITVVATVGGKRKRR